MAVAGALLPKMREIQSYVWRRHLAANADRLLASSAGQGDRRELAVGFADLVGYTSRSRGMGGRELGAMVEDFESIATEVIARHRGRVVKTVGDGVLFTAVAAVDAVEIGLRLPEVWDSRGAPAAARGCRLRRGPDPARRRLLAGGQPGQPADLDRPPRDDAGRPRAGRAAAATCPSTGSGRCAGCRSAATTTSSRGWSAGAATDDAHDESGYDEDSFDEGPTATTS